MDGLNVALVNFTYGGGSGSGRHVYLLEKGLRELGVDVRVFHSGNVPHLRLPKTGSLSFALFSSAKLRGFELVRSEEHTSELQSLAYLVCRLLLLLLSLLGLSLRRHLLPDFPTSK